MMTPLELALITTALMYVSYHIGFNRGKWIGTPGAVQWFVDNDYIKPDKIEILMEKENDKQS